uniref:Uncharacterized protein C4orf29 homolog n=1 Tax=Phallusia mammillata TaxID=59560 RepID=A0A6F9D6E2_9ASCI|nr:uncharacterized protein C4orf29 homolog [Phallusia mammillata]
MSGLSKIDLFYRRLVLTKFYTEGWGKPEEIKEILQMHKLISNRETCSKLVNPHYEVKIDQEIKSNNCTLVKGHFVTPLMEIVPNLVPNSIKVANFEVVLPKGKRFGKLSSQKPACIHMAGTGDHGFSRRRELLAKPLLNSGITSLLLENPFYGVRKPKEQWRSGLLKVSDLFVMGSCLILEAQVLLHWLKQLGYGPLGLTGISMGGHMASLAATNWPEPIALIPCLSWTSASVVWTDGVLSKAVPWRVLESQYAKNPRYEKEIFELLDGIDSYKLGKSFGSQNAVDSTDIEKKEALQHNSAEKLDKARRQQETIQFMRGVMDQVTHLGNFSKPVDTSAVTFVVGKGDAYFPRSTLKPMDEVWPGCEIREFDAGHVAGILMHYPDFVQAIIDTFDRVLKKQAKLNNQVNNSNNVIFRPPQPTSKLALPLSMSVWLKAFALKS